MLHDAPESAGQAKATKDRRWRVGVRKVGKKN